MDNIINLSFPVSGNELPADQNYRLYAAISKQFPQLHRLNGLAINTIPGIPNQRGTIHLTPSSRLILRLPVEAIAQVYPLAGQTLDIGGYLIQLGNPELQTLKPTNCLSARLVTIKGYTKPAPFLVAAYRQLKALDINADISIAANNQGEPKRLTLKITKQRRSYTIVGFSVIASNLTPDDSVKLQIHGLGGKRRIGCGIFCPPFLVKSDRRNNHYTATTIS
ncbi:MAG: type I-MYXAN CRISPR-associated protein Cas6/Cmx6 [Coleofasciculaceae cyanobacterium]